MADFTMRAQSPLSDEQWNSIEKIVVDVARRVLVGRRLIPIFGPLGPGVQTVSDDEFTGAGVGLVSTFGEEPGAIVQAQARRYVALPIIYKDFRIYWRDVETSRQFGVPLEVSTAAGAAAFTAQAEDSLIFNGDAALGQHGLLDAPGRTTIPLSDWGVMGNAFRDVVAATEALLRAGFFGPYALVVSPVLYANMNRVYENTGVLEIEQVRKLMTAGVYQTAVVPEPTAVVISATAENLDLALGQDYTVAFLETRDMNHYFRVFETLALRTKRHGAICTLEGEPARRGGAERGRRGRRPRTADREAESEA